MRQTGYPHGQPGYVIDHSLPLKKGGCDCRATMPGRRLKQPRPKINGNNTRRGRDRRLESREAIGLSEPKPGWSGT
jgi:hypothetical protein